MKRILRLYAGILVGLIGGALLMDRSSCLDEWEGSGMRVRYGFTSGCRIETAPGKWIPAKAYAYREVTP